MPSAPSSSGRRRRGSCIRCSTCRRRSASGRPPRRRWRSGIRRKVVTPDKGRTLKALLEVERSREAEREGRPNDALALAREAFGLAPGTRRGDPALRRAADQGGRRQEGDEDDRARLGGGAASRSRHALPRSLGRDRGAEADRRRAPAGAAESRPTSKAIWRSAQASLDAGLWGEARRHLDTAAGTNPPTRVCRMMAEVEERAQSGPDKVREWLGRAADAPADRAWRCTSCGAHHEAWRPVCESCGAFGTPAMARARHLRPYPAARDGAGGALADSDTRRPTCRHRPRTTRQVRTEETPCSRRRSRAACPSPPGSPRPTSCGRRGRCPESRCSRPRTMRPSSRSAARKRPASTS